MAIHIYDMELPRETVIDIDRYGQIWQKLCPSRYKKIKEAKARRCSMWSIDISAWAADRRGRYAFRDNQQASERRRLHSKKGETGRC